MLPSTLLSLHGKIIVLHFNHYGRQITCVKILTICLKLETLLSNDSKQGNQGIEEIILLCKVQFRFIYIMSAIRESCFQTLYRNPGFDPQQATLARKKLPSTGRILEQDQTHTRGAQEAMGIYIKFINYSKLSMQEMARSVGSPCSDSSTLFTWQRGSFVLSEDRK